MVTFLPAPFPADRGRQADRVLQARARGRIDDEDQVIRGHVFEFAHHQFAAARGGAPVDPARAVAAAEGAEPVELALGAEVPVRTLEDDEKLKIPMGTQTGTVFRLKGKGMPVLGGRGRGDLFVSVSVVTPTSLTREQRKLLEQLAAVENKDLEDKGLVDKVRDIFG